MSRARAATGVTFVVVSFALACWSAVSIATGAYSATPATPLIHWIAGAASGLVVAATIKRHAERQRGQHSSQHGQHPQHKDADS